jgi:CRP-like cAMP-binding protein
MSESDHDITELPDCGVLEGFDAESRRTLFDAGEICVLPARAYFAKQGEPQDSMAIIVRGKVSVSCRARGEVVKLAELGAGEIMGEMSAIDPAMASASVRVVDGPATVWTLSAAGFEDLVEQSHGVGVLFLKAIASRLCKRIRHNSDVMLSNSEQSRHRFLDLDY